MNLKLGEKLKGEKLEGEKLKGEKLEASKGEKLEGEKLEEKSPKERNSKEKRSKERRSNQKSSKVLARSIPSILNWLLCKVDPMKCQHLDLLLYLGGASIEAPLKIWEDWLPPPPGHLATWPGGHVGWPQVWPSQLDEPKPPAHLILIFIGRADL